MSLFLCVDCGGSKTSAVICDANGMPLGRALGGSSNFSRLPVDAFIEVVRMTVSNALNTFVSPPHEEPFVLPPSKELFASAWLGIAGVDSPGAVDRASSALSDLLGIPIGPRLIVTNDAHLLAAPLRLYPDVSHAVTAIAGTGSCVVSYSQVSFGMPVQVARTGGLGWILGDEGSGFHVGKEAIRQMLLDVAHDSLGMPPSPPSILKSRILTRFGISGEENAAEVLSLIYRPESTTNSGNVADYLLLPRENRLSQLSRLVFDAAFQEGDEFAQRILRITASGLADQIAMLCIGPKEDLNMKPRGVVAGNAVLCFGGSLVGVNEYQALVVDELKARGYIFRCVEFVEDLAQLGATGLALMVTKGT